MCWGVEKPVNFSVIDCFCSSGDKKVEFFSCLTTTLMSFRDTLVCYKNAKMHDIGTRGREINQKGLKFSFIKSQ